MSILRKSFSLGLCAVALACASVGASAATVTLKYEEDANYRLRVSVDADLGSSSQFKSVSTGNLFMNVNDVNGTDQFKPDTSILAWCLELLVPLSEENAVYNVDGSGTQSWLGSLQKLVNQRYTEVLSTADSIVSSAMQLAVELDRWRLDSRTVNFMVGGPEGLAPEVCARADQRWSLSPLTLPHPLVRILIGEQLYRAWTVLSGHPYHK